MSLDQSLDPDLLAALCRRAGLSTTWEDAFSKVHEVTPENLGFILGAFGLDVSTDEEARALIARLEAEDACIPPMLTGEQGGELVLPVPPGAWHLSAEEGWSSRGTMVAHDDGASLTLPDRPGYYRLEIDGRNLTVAVAPPRCFTVRDALAEGGSQRTRGWGLAQQLYALRRPGDGGVGDFEGLAQFVREAASHGADAVSISPVHAQFSADPDRFSPYAPSSRIMLNVLHIAVEEPGEEAARLETLDLVDWPAVARDRLSRLRLQFDRIAADETGFGDWADFTAWRDAEGEKVEAHALFEALHMHLWRERDLSWHWKDWPEEYRTPDAAGSRAFAEAHPAEIGFHAWMQYRADRELRAAQDAAEAAGMAIGLVSDLAVGTDSGGSHCWSRQGETLVGLTVGAPPDLLQKDGQNWGITAFYGRGLRRNGYRAFIEMLSGTMRHAGGVRIDHAMGLARLWVVPEGRSAADGIYMQLPETDLMRLVRLESHRNRAIVLGEDLGTVPEGFPDRLQAAGIDGMRVLWFERDKNGFRPPPDWTVHASAMTSTHDLPTVAGWWKGIDIAHQRALGASQDDEDRARAARASERSELWQAMCRSGAAAGAQPAEWDAFPVVDAAVAQVGGSACELAMIPTEDAVGLEEQPNIPGTTNEHPNWRRRLHRPVGEVLADERTSARLQRLGTLRDAGSDSSDD